MGLQTTYFTMLLLVDIALLVLTFYGHLDVEEEGSSTKCLGYVILVYPIAGMLMYVIVRNRCQMPKATDEICKHNLGTHAKQGIGTKVV